MAIHLFDSFHQHPGMKFPCRSVLVNEGGRVILISPVHFSEGQIRQIRAIGEVTDLVAPSLLHHLAMPNAIELFPGARVWGVAGFKKKRPDIPWTDELTTDTWPYQEILELIFIKGAPQLNEVEFFHKASRTLVVTDLCFNMHRPKGFTAAILLRIVGTYDHFAVSRIFKMFVKNKTAFEESLAQLFQKDFDRLVMSHGAGVETGGKAKLKDALQARGFRV